MDLLYSMVPLALGVATPIIISSLGGLFSERSGIVNIALEGIMLVGAFAGATSSILLEGSLGALAPWVGILIGAFFGIVLSILCSTPVGATIVILDLILFFVNCKKNTILREKAGNDKACHDKGSRPSFGHIQIHCFTRFGRSLRRQAGDQTAGARNGRKDELPA